MWKLWRKKNNPKHTLPGVTSCEHNQRQQDSYEVQELYYNQAFQPTVANMTQKLYIEWTSNGVLQGLHTVYYQV